MNTSLNRLADKVSVVTGASKGIGASIALHLARAGSAIVVNYNSDKAGADAVVGKITSEGGKAIAVQGDTSKAEDMDRLFSETKSQFGKLDVLVNNAGVFEFKALEEITEEHFHRQFNINVLGLLLASQRAVAAFGSEGGNIINISSVVSQDPVSGGAVYSATKAAVDAITKALSTELGPRGIRVNSINPGPVETEGVHAAGFIGTDFFNKVIQDTPLGRIGQPDDIGSAVAFVASEEARWITGQAIQVAGGLR